SPATTGRQTDLRELGPPPGAAPHQGLLVPGLEWRAMAGGRGGRGVHAGPGRRPAGVDPGRHGHPREGGSLPPQAAQPGRGAGPTGPTTCSPSAPGTSPGRTRIASGGPGGGTPGPGRRRGRTGWPRSSRVSTATGSTTTAAAGTATAQPPRQHTYPDGDGVIA